MADGTKIEWTDASWTPIRARHWEIQNDGSGKERIGWHCEHVSEGCRICYAEGINRRLGTGLDYKPGHLYRPEREGYRNGEAKLFLDEKMLLAPLRWKRPRMIFVCSMTDLFADFVPDEWIDRVLAIAALCPQHTFQILTKRPERMRRYFAGIPEMPELPAARDAMIEGSAQSIYADRTGENPSLWLAVHMPLPNVWLGVSVEDQAAADERIPILLDTPAAVRWISAEPLLGPVDLRDVGTKETLRSIYPRFVDWIESDLRPEPVSTLAQDGLLGTFHYKTPNHMGGCAARGASPRIDWVVAGGESGGGARPMHPDWARSLRDQCAAAGVPFLFKQWGEWGAPSDDLGKLDWPYHRDYDRTHWFDARTCVRPAEAGWMDKYVGGGGAWPPPPFDMFTTPEYLDQVSRCHQETCRAAGRCQGNAARTAVTRVGKKAAGRLLDGVLHDGFPEVRR